MPVLIADTACVDPGADLADDVEIGPYCIVGPGVRIGRGTRLVGHACVFGPAILGAANTVAPFVVIGRDATDQTEPIRIGDRNEFAPGVVVDPAIDSREPTRIGSHGTLGPHAHVGSGCDVDDRARIDAAAQLGTRVVVGQGSVISAGVTVHPRVTIGPHAFVGGPSRVFHDVPPYMLADGHPAKIRGLHLIGLKRLGLAPDTLRALHEAHRLLYRGRLQVDAVADQLLSRGQATPEVVALLDFLRRQRDGAHGRARDRPADDQAA